MKILFHHIPRTAGTSVKSWLASCFDDQKLDLIAGHDVAHLIPSMPPDTLKITVVREPVDRILSAFYFHQGADAKVSKLLHYVRHWHDTLHYQNIDLDQFDIVGIYEELPVFCDLVAQTANLEPFDGRWLNQTAGQPRAAEVPLGIIEEMRDILVGEIAIYDRCRRTILDTP